MCSSDLRRHSSIPFRRACFHTGPGSAFKCGSTVSACAGVHESGMCVTMLLRIEGMGISEVDCVAVWSQVEEPPGDREGVDSSAVGRAILFGIDGATTFEADCVASCALRVEELLGDLEGVESSAVCLTILFGMDGATTFEANCVVGCASRVEEPLGDRGGIESSAVCIVILFGMEGAVTSEADCVVGCASRVEGPLDEQRVESLGMCLTMLPELEGMASSSCEANCVAGCVEEPLDGADPFAVCLIMLPGLERVSTCEANCVIGCAEQVDEREEMA